MVLRGENVSATMSRYLHNRIERMANIEVVPNSEVAAVHGNGEVEAVSLRESGNGRVRRIPTSAVFVMIGAEPCTDFVAGDVRSESTKRVAGAVGDGALAVRFAHRVLYG